MSATVHTFAEKGCPAAPIRDIAENAGVNLALFNHYCKSRENLFAIIRRPDINPFRFALNILSFAFFPHILSPVTVKAGPDSQQEFSAVFRERMQLVPQWKKQMPELTR